MVSNEKKDDIFNYGLELYQSQNWRQAIECFQKILNSDTRLHQAQFYLALCYTELNQPDIAKDYFTQLLDVGAYQLQAVIGLLQLGDTKQSQATNKIIGLANKILSEGAVRHEQIIQLNFALGNYFDKTTEYDRAFSYFKEANDLKQVTSRYDKKRHTAYINRIISVFNQQLFKKTCGLGIESDLPVFLVGTPRSGKSMTESLLKKHPNVAGAGEVQYLSLDGIITLEKGLKHHGVYPESIQHIQQHDAHPVAKQYLSVIQQFIDDQTKKILDTMPANTMNMGTISILFPNASVIFCTREPMDVATEIYFNNFARGHDYSSSLENIACYVENYRKLREHWLVLLPIKMMQVNYQDLTGNPINTTKHLFDFLDIHSSIEQEHTLSQYQGQVIHQNQIGSWKNYDVFLSPLKEKLLTT